MYSTAARGGIGSRAVRIAVAVALAAATVGLLGVTASDASGRLDVRRERFGTMPDGTVVHRYVLTNGRGGSAILLGISGAQRPTIDPDTLTLNQLRVHGSFAASRAAWRWVVELDADGILDPAPLVTHRFGLEEAPLALAAPGGDAVKVLVRPGR